MTHTEAAARMDRLAAEWTAYEAQARAEGDHQGAADAWHHANTAAAKATAHRRAARGEI